MVARFFNGSFLVASTLYIIGFFGVFGYPSAASAQISSFPTSINKTGSQFRIARLKYEGGSDWYNGQTEEPNMLKYLHENTNIDVDPQYFSVDVASDDIFNYP